MEDEPSLYGSTRMSASVDSELSSFCGLPLVAMVMAFQLMPRNYASKVLSIPSDGLPVFFFDFQNVQII